MGSLHVQPSAADLDVCELLVAAHRSGAGSATAWDQHQNPLLSIAMSRLPTQTRVAALGALAHCLEITRTSQGCQSLYPETALLARLRDGQGHVSHADNERHVAGQWVPNHTPYRDFAGLLYLNSGFTGGQLRFQRPDLPDVVPTAGLYVTFPCTRDFVHEVAVVEQGERYSMAMWFTTDPDHVNPILAYGLSQLSGQLA